MVGIKVWTYNLMTLRMCRFVSANSSYYNFKLLMFPCLIAKKEDVAKLTSKKEECKKRLKKSTRQSIYNILKINELKC